MKIRIADFKYKNGSFPLVEIDMKKVHLTDVSNDEGVKFTALTEHTVSSVVIVDGVETLEYLNKYNHPFEYKGGNAFNEAMQSLSEYFTKLENGGV